MTTSPAPVAWQAAPHYGIHPGFSVDNETSYGGDLFMEMHVAFYLQRVVGRRRRCGSIATPGLIDGPAYAVLERYAGNLTPGKQANAAGDRPDPFSESFLPIHPA